MPPMAGSGAIRPTRPILPAMRRLLAFVLLATLFARMRFPAGGRLGPTGAHPDRCADQPRSGRPG